MGDRAEADRARSNAVEADEAVVTVRETASADSHKQIELIEARKPAERQAIRRPHGAGQRDEGAG